MAASKVEVQVDSREWQQFCLRGHIQTVAPLQLCSQLVKKVENGADYSRLSNVEVDTDLHLPI